MIQLDKQLLDKDLLGLKYGFYLDGLERVYKLDLDASYHNLEFTTPVKLIINGYKIEDNAWSNLILKLNLYIHSVKPYINLLDFEPSWGDCNPFSKRQISPIWSKIDDNLYCYRSFDSDHSYRFIVEILDYCGFDMDDSYILVHRSPRAEPKEVVDYFSKQIKTKFKEYLQDNYQYDDNRCEKIIRNIDGPMNKILSDMSQSYNDWFSFTNMPRLSSFASKYSRYIYEKTTLKDNAIKQILRYLEMIKNFYHYIVFDIKFEFE